MSCPDEDVARGRDEAVRTIVTELYQYQERIMALTRRLKELTTEAQDA